MSSGKPLGTKAYGHIPHLPGSRLCPSDHMVSPGQVRICLEKPRGRHDRIIVQEKTDGSCCSACKLGGAIIPLVRVATRPNPPGTSSTTALPPWSTPTTFVSTLCWPFMQNLRDRWKGRRGDRRVQT